MMSADIALSLGSVSDFVTIIIVVIVIIIVDFIIYDPCALSRLLTLQYFFLFD